MTRPDRRIDSRAIGLDTWLHFARWLTGHEHLHYGLWDGLAPTAANLGPAQEAYTDVLLSHLPQDATRVLDVGGGAGETAARLIARGHAVEIVVPSSLLAQRCRANAPQATIHEARFEDAVLQGPFDAILFSESWQYIPQAFSLSACAKLLRQGGTLLVADCFRSEAYREAGRRGIVGGGHRLSRFRAALADAPFDIEHEADLTDSVAPSIDLEQGLYNILGHAVARTDAELAAKRPRTRWALTRALGLVLSARRRERLQARLMERHRTAEAFARYNRYLLVRLRRR